MGGVLSSIGSTVGNAIGGLTGGLAQGLTPQNNFQAQTPLNVANLQGQINTSQGNLAGVQTNQNALAQALLAQSQGQGPNPAQAMLNQATNQNVKQNAGLLASAKGINPALAAMQAGQNAANIGQQAAGQGAVMGAQQQLNAQSNLQNLYGQQAGENLQNIGTSGSLANNSSLGAQGINAGTAAQNAAATQNTSSGILNAGGSALKAFLNKGGMVQHFDDGGQVSEIGQLAPLILALMNHGGAVKGYDDGGQIQQGIPVQGYVDGTPLNEVQPFDSKGYFGSSNASNSIANQILKQGGVQTYATGMTPPNFGMTSAPSKPSQGLKTKQGPKMAGGPQDQGGVQGHANRIVGGNANVSVSPTNNSGSVGIGTGGDYNYNILTASKGGKIPSHFHPIAKIYHPNFGNNNTAGLKSEGGDVPGKAPISGDSPKNDIVPTMLSPGELVLPRTVMNSEDPERAAADFVAKELAKKGKSDSHNDFKEALKVAIGSRRGK